MTNVRMMPLAGLLCLAGFLTAAREFCRRDGDWRDQHCDCARHEHPLDGGNVHLCHRAGSGDRRHCQHRHCEALPAYGFSVSHIGLLF